MQEQIEQVIPKWMSTPDGLIQRKGRKSDRSHDVIEFCGRKHRLNRRTGYRVITEDVNAIVKGETIHERVRVDEHCHRQQQTNARFFCHLPFPKHG